MRKYPADIVAIIFANAEVAVKHYAYFTAKAVFRKPITLGGVKLARKRVQK
jgi:hypothetical protein